MGGRLSISLLGFFIVAPFFLSIGVDGNIAMNRIGSDNHSWLVTLPISLIVAFVFMVTKIKNVFVSKELLFYFTYFSICFLILIAGKGIDYSAIKVLVFMTVFISLIFGFQLFFHQKLKDIADLEIAENKFILYPLVIILLLALLSHYYFVNLQTILDNQEFFHKSTFLINSITIYNWEQYFAFVFVLLLGSATRLNFIVFGVLFLLSLYIGGLNSNTTALILMMLLFGIFISFKAISERLHPLSQKLIVFLIVTFPLVYLFFGTFIIELFNISEHGLIKRYSLVQIYFSEVDWYDLILPFGSIRPFDADNHNEFIEIFNASSMLGFILYYYFILKRVLSIKVKFKMQMIAILLVIFIGGITVENTLHPYMLVSLAYFISFYVAASKKIKNEMIAKTV
ncbi:hypothetical protein N9E74_01100 [Candidatus Pseudothioglobus singularis]|nr:hypothetical protein [Candidatus Pseudothioglobus singularis]